MTAAAVPDLWPDEVRADILTPLAILRIQAGYLNQRVGGILQADVTTHASTAIVSHQLVLKAPSLEYSTAIVAVRHPTEQFYPATVKSSAFLPALPPHASEATRLAATMAAVSAVAGAAPFIPPHFDPPADERAANSHEELVELLREVLRSGRIVALTQSLIARSNEAAGNGQPPAPAG